MEELQGNRGSCYPWQALSSRGVYGGGSPTLPEPRSARRLSLSAGDAASFVKTKAACIYRPVPPLHAISSYSSSVLSPRSLPKHFQYVCCYVLFHLQSNIYIKNRFVCNQKKCLKPSYATVFTSFSTKKKKSNTFGFMNNTEKKTVNLIILIHVLKKCAFMPHVNLQ